MISRRPLPPQADLTLEVAGSPVTLPGEAVRAILGALMPVTEANGNASVLLTLSYPKAVRISEASLITEAQVSANLVTRGRLL